ncbi:MAG: protein-glutamate O-methyltransferase CheR [Natronospirillum sp.]|uniref:CheR family methyltransferase n=1 Tax=Natronospirillum sp. TaxID=2812955 RepID=UPI0025F646E7|nr:CheR family methyltransferase [Natronospirillum sp.]MCH8551701.1 protein-glutamate O-methyltransferase CheR [Natronospirillum sp.]
MMGVAAIEPHTGWSFSNAFDDDQFDQWQKLLEARTGMRFTRAQRSLLQTRLGQRMAEAGYEDYQAYYEHVTAGGMPAASEWQALIDYLTVQETRFFRDPMAMELVGEHLHARWQRNTGPVQLWSVGCATGEEAYSLAMVAAEMNRKAKTPRPYAITGSDISAPAIHKARLGRYHRRKLEPVPVSLQQRYFDWRGEEATVRRELAEHLCFTRLNVLDLEDAPMTGMDVIFCQNLLIYFRRWRRRDLVNELVSRLKPGGMLVLGPGELAGYDHPDLVPISSRNNLAWLRKYRTEHRE